MAYSQANGRPCRRATGLFSSPDVRFRNYPTGERGERDNVRVLNATLSRVASYRTAQTTTPPRPPTPPEPEAPASQTLVVPLAFAGQVMPTETIIRLANAAAAGTTAKLSARNDEGVACSPFQVDIPGNEVRAVRSPRLAEQCPGLGTRLHVAIEAPAQVSATVLIRSPGGFMSTMNAVLPTEAGMQVAEIFNPGSNRSKKSYLRLVNLEGTSASVTVEGRDDSGEGAVGGTARITIPAHGARTISAQALEGLEDDPSVSGSLGDGNGKWRLGVTSTKRIAAVSYLQMVTGEGTFLSNLSQGLGKGTGGAPPPTEPEPPEPGTVSYAGVAVTPNQAEPREQVRLSATLRNNGQGESAGQSGAWMRSLDSHISTSDSPVSGSTAPIGPIPRRGERTVTLLTNAPETAGTYYYGHCLLGASGKCSQGARLTVMQVAAQPDLVIEEPGVSVYRYIGGGSWRAYVSNIGHAKPPVGTITVGARWGEQVLGTDEVRVYSFYGLEPGERSYVGGFWDDIIPPVGSTIVLRAGTGDRTKSLQDRAAAEQALMRSYVGGFWDDIIPPVGSTISICVDPVPNERNSGNNCSPVTVGSSYLRGTSAADRTKKDLQDRAAAEQALMRTSDSTVCSIRQQRSAERPGSREAQSVQPQIGTSRNVGSSLVVGQFQSDPLPAGRQAGTPAAPSPVRRPTGRSSRLRAGLGTGKGWRVHRPPRPSAFEYHPRPRGVSFTQPHRWPRRKARCGPLPELAGNTPFNRTAPAASSMVGLAWRSRARWTRPAPPSPL